MTATLPPPEVMLERIATRERQHAGWLVRADAWANSRAAGAPVEVIYPRDAAAIAALGVPCDDCLTLVHRQGEDGHVIRYWAESGRHWAALISAHCGRSGL